MRRLAVASITTPPSRRARVDVIDVANAAPAHLATSPAPAPGAC
ncbi:hypothetical protein [Nitrogeniibacter mangrovi]|nr:hypothetical protein [Nitrogeniibacter mangrovi]